MILLVVSCLFTLATEPGTIAKVAGTKKDNISFIRPGIHAEFLNVATSDSGVVTVTFTLTDDFGGKLDMDGLRTPGPISAGYFLANISDDRGTFQTLSGSQSTNSETGFSSFIPSTDRGGELQVSSDGVYTYTFGTTLPEGFDPGKTYAIAAYFRRDLRDFDMDRVADNVVQGFVPNGGEPDPLRDVVRRETCNNCHHDLSFHGGSRKEINVCSMCHQPGVLDLETGNSIAMEVMIHKIHRGADLPSVKAGIPYQINSSRSVNDFSDIVFPQPIQNCVACHKPDVAQPDGYLVNASRATCGSCHDNIDFENGQGHFVQESDAFCAGCHIQQGDVQYDWSLLRVHTVDYRSPQLAGININILRVLNATPGSFPEVHFTLKANDGTDIDPASLSFFNFVMAGPNTDYNFVLSQRAVSASVWVDDHYEFTFSEAIPENAAGSYTMGAEAYRNVVLNPGTANEKSMRETAENPVFAFAVTDAAPIARRTVVDDAKCEKCHDNLALHGTIRHNPSYCVTCHNPEADDSPYRPEGEAARTIDFKFMIHRIHKGEELLNDYTIVGYGGREINYNHVVYPGILSRCENCHVDDSYFPPAKGNVATIAPYEFYSPIPPTSAACLGCHDSIDAASHAYTNTAPMGETCEACHGAGKEFAADKVHGAN